MRTGFLPGCDPSAQVTAREAGLQLGSCNCWVKQQEINSGSQTRNQVNWLLKFSQTLHMSFWKQHPGKRIWEGVWYHKSSEKCKYNPECYCFCKVQKVLFSILKYVFNLSRITLLSLLLSSGNPQISFPLPIPWFPHLTLPLLGHCYAHTYGHAQVY